MIGQSCISVQRVIVLKDVYDQFQEKLLKEVKQLKLGNPYDESGVIGPLVNINETMRVQQWIEEAVDKGATILEGGTIDMLGSIDGYLGMFGLI